jgi:hypothetical protein
VSTQEGPATVASGGDDYPTRERSAKSRAVLGAVGLGAVALLIYAGYIVAVYMRTGG